jgi:hypothetical protein
MDSARQPGDRSDHGARADAGQSDGATPSGGATRTTADPDEARSIALSIPGTSEQAARDVEAVSPEGRPADAKSGPGTVWMEVGVAALIIIAGATAVGLYFGVVGGLAAFFLGLLALLANPSVGAAMLRTRDRSEAIDRVEHRHPVHESREPR